MSDQSPIRIFIAYSKHDKSFLEELIKHFYLEKRKGTIEIFYDGVIEAGKDWDKEIKHKLYSSDIILLLVSANFIHTDYCYEEEMQKAIGLHEAGTAQVIPIILTPFNFDGAPFAHLNFLPAKAKPISTYTDLNHQQAYTDIGSALKKNYETAHKLRAAKLAAEQAAQAEAEKQKTAEQEEKQRHTNFITLCQQADEAFAEKKWMQARKYYKEAMELHQNGYKPTEAIIKGRIGDCTDEISAADHQIRATKYEQQQDYPNAIAQLQEAIQLKPALLEALKPRLEHLQTQLQAKQEAEARLAAELKAKQEAEAATKLFNYEMINVQGGTFEMGGDIYDAEKPIHTVTLKDYYIGKYPVTQAQWQAVMGTNPSYFKGDNLPVERVSWEDIQIFLGKLNAQTGKKYRLPTEAEWEYAARGGTKSGGYEYAGSNDIEEVAWYWENSGDKKLSGEWDFRKMNKNNCRTQPVGKKKPNELGIYDMSGNVWEWCEDKWHSSYAAAPVDGSAWKTGDSSFRVIRGGSWDSNPQTCRVARRGNDTPDYRYRNDGFRIVVSQ